MNHFKIKHGEECTFDFANPRFRDTMAKIVDGQNIVVFYLFQLMTSSKNNKLVVPCKQCWKDTALMFKDIGSLMDELVDGKVSPKS